MLLSHFLQQPGGCALPLLWCLLLSTCTPFSWPVLCLPLLLIYISSLAVTVGICDRASAKEMIIFLPVWIFTCTVGIAMYVNISILLSLSSLNIYFGDRILTVLVRQISYLGSKCLCFQVLGLQMHSTVPCFHYLCSCSWAAAQYIGHAGFEFIAVLLPLPPRC